MNQTYSIRIIFDGSKYDTTLISGFTYKQAFEYARKCVTKEINYLLFSGRNVNIYVENDLGKRLATYYVY